MIHSYETCSHNAQRAAVEGDDEGSATLVGNTYGSILPLSFFSFQLHVYFLSSNFQSPTTGFLGESRRLLAGDIILGHIRPASALCLSRNLALALNLDLFL